jgi:hypothetical protein
MIRRCFLAYVTPGDCTYPKNLKQTLIESAAALFAPGVDDALLCQTFLSSLLPVAGSSARPLYFLCSPDVAPRFERGSL